MQEVRLILLNPSPLLSGRRPAPAAPAFFLSLLPTLLKNRRFLEMHHDFGSEPAIDLTRPLLAQRSRWHRNTLYDKVRYGYACYGYSLPRP